MSSIIFNRMMQQIPANKACETEEEVDDDNYNFNNADVDSKSYLVNLYKVCLFANKQNIISTIQYSFYSFCFQNRI